MLPQRRFDRVELSGVLKPVLKGLTTTVVFFLLTEIGLAAAYSVRNAMVHYVALPYAFGDDYGPTPPWFDHLQILQSDPDLVWRNRPNVHRTYLNVFSPIHAEADRIALLRRFLPTIPAEFNGNPTWEIRLDSEGFRGAELKTSSAPGTIRVACIGDSWTFGMPVNEAETYPSRLGASLREALPDRIIDVQNYGVLGYSSFQGVQVLRNLALKHQPDVIVIGFGMNDSEIAGYRDRDMVEHGVEPLGPRVESAIKNAVDASEDYRLLKYAALAVKFHPKSIASYLSDDSDGKAGSEPIDYATMEPWTRVSPRDYESNIREMISLARTRGLKVVLLDNELWARSPYRAILMRLSSELDVPFVDSLTLITGAREKIERDLESRLQLRPGIDSSDAHETATGTTTVVFRVSRGTFPVSRALSIVGADPALGNSVPNTVLMHDDGQSEDERAGDGVWSYAAALPRGKSIAYLYTNSGTAGQWEGLDVPHVRRIVVPASPDGEPVYLPVETFGRVYMQGDDWHTDAAGYNVIGRAAAQAIEPLLAK